MEQRIGRLRDRRGRSIPYSTVGQGRPLLVCETGFVTHLEVLWSYPPLRRFLEALAQSHRVIRFDVPGTGMAAGEPGIGSFEERCEVFEDVVDGLGLRDFDALATCQAGPPLLALDARHPGRVRRLILFGTFADGAGIAPKPVPAVFSDLIRASWGFAAGAIAEVMLPDADRSARHFWAKLMSSAVSADEGAHLFAEAFVTDVRDLLPRVTSETLVLHRRRDRCVPLALAREVASGIPGARMTVLEGSSHLLYVGDPDPVLEATLDFLGDGRRPLRMSRALSAREREVARLIEHGLSNAEIALRLGITLRTAESHVEHIRDKLGFRSRSQVAVWAARNLVRESGQAPQLQTAYR